MLRARLPQAVWLPGSAQTTRATREVWVAKLNGSGSQLLYLVYIGGSGNDSGTGIAVDTFGNAYVTGTTGSTNFPTTSGAFSTQSAGPQEAFVAKFSPTGQIQYSTFLGGGSDAGFAIAVDSYRRRLCRRPDRIGIISHHRGSDPTLL